MTRRTKIWTIARKDIVEVHRDGRFRIAASIVLVLLLMSMLVGGKYASETRQERNVSQHTAYDQWLNQGSRNAHSATHYGMYAFKPLSTLAFVDKGVDAYTGTAVFMESHKRNEFRLRPAKDMASIARFGELTAAIVLQLFVPLLIVLLAFPAFAGELESGTLRQVISLGVSRLEFGFGKVVGIAFGLAALLVPAIGAGAVGLFFAGEVTVDDLVRAALFVGFYAAYYLIVLLIALAASARFSSRAALVLMLGFWIVSALIIPRGASDAAKRIYNSPSTIDFSRQIEQEILEGENDRNAELRKRVLAEYRVERIEDLPFNFEGMDLQDSEARGDRIIDTHYARLNEIFVRQNRVQEIIALLSPAQAIRLLSMGLAGTDIAQQQDFARAAEDYRRLMVREMNRAVEENVGEADANYRGTQALSRRTDRETWERVPPFEYKMPDAAWVVRNHVWSVAGLAVWLVIASIAAFLSIAGLRIP